MLVILLVLGCRTPTASKAYASSPSKRKFAKSENASSVTRLQSSEPRRSGGTTNLLDKLPAAIGDEAGQEVAVRILAMVNGKPIFEQEVQTASFQQLQATLTMPALERERQQKKIRKQTLEDLINLEVVIQEAAEKLKKVPQTRKRLEDSAAEDFEKKFVAGMIKGNRLQNRDQLEVFLDQRGLSLPLMKRQWVRRIISQEFLRSLALSPVEKINRRQLLDYYNENAHEFVVKDNVKWQDIFISSEKHGSAAKAKALANQIIAQLRDGADFVELCKKYDDGNSSLSGGEGIGSLRGEIQPREAEDILFSMRDGEIAPPVEIISGYHVIRLVKRERAGRKPFNEDVQRLIRVKLRSQIAGREMKRIVNRLRRRAIIEYAQK